MGARERLIGFVVLALVIVAAAWIGVVSPKRSQVTNLNAQIATEQGTVSTEISQLTAAKQARAVYGKQVRAVNVVDRSVPLSDQEPALIRLIDKEERGYNITWTSTSITLGAGTATGGAGSIGLTFAYTATRWIDLQHFFVSLDKLTRTNGSNLGVTGRLFTINSVTVEPDAASKITASVSMTVYVLPAATPAATPGTTTTTASP
jgi:hypothetical protein